METEPGARRALHLPRGRWRLLAPLAALGLAALALALFAPRPVAPPDPDGLLPGSSSIPLGDTLRLWGEGLALYTDPQADPPLFELSGTALYLPDLAADRDPRLPATITRYRLEPAAAAAIIAEAKRAGARGPIYLPDPDRDAPGWEFRLILIESGGETARITLLGEAQPGEGGPDAALRAALWELIGRLRTAATSFALPVGEPYLPTRYVVRATRLPDGEPWASAARDWPLEHPGEWGAGCRIFSGEAATRVIETLGAEPFGRAWRDGGGSLWMFVARPVLPAEPAPCDAVE